CVQFNDDIILFFFFQAEDGIRDRNVTGVQTCALPILADAIDRTGPVVGDEDGAILVEQDIGGTAEIALVTLDPAGGEDFLLGVRSEERRVGKEGGGRREECAWKGTWKGRRGW